MTDPVVIHVHPLSEVRQRLSGILARFRREGAAAEWAGQIRTVGIAKGAMFCLPQYIDSSAATGWVSVSPEFETAIDVPDPEERARHVENAIRDLLGQAPAPA